jgi:cell division septation protein DedD
MPMDTSLKQRLVGAVVLVALAVIFLPMLVKGPAPDSGVSDVALDVPAEPAAADGMVSRDLPLVAPAGAPEGGATGMPSSMPDAPAPSAQDGAFPATAAGDHAVSFGSYATAADADKVIAALKAAELPGYRETVTLNGRQAERVRIGPFADLRRGRVRAPACGAGESERRRQGHCAGCQSGRVAVACHPLHRPQCLHRLRHRRNPNRCRPPPPSLSCRLLRLRRSPLSWPMPSRQRPWRSRRRPRRRPPRPEPASKPADTSKTGFAVQVGAFADAAAATPCAASSESSATPKSRPSCTTG